MGPPMLGPSLSNFIHLVERRSTSLKMPRRPKAPPPTTNGTPVVKRTRSLKRTASLNDFDTVLADFSLSDKSPDKTLLSLKAKAKKRKDKSLSPFK
jgi:hypothetical protein